MGVNPIRRFHYFLIIGTSPVDHESAVSAKGVRLVSVNVKNAPGMHLPTATRTDDDEFMVDRWQLVPVPSNARSPEELLARLNRPLDSGTAAPLKLTLAHFGEELGRDLPRYRGHLASDFSQTLGSVIGGEFLIKTAPHGPETWLWWTVVSQDRPDPAFRPGAPGTAVRVREFLYLDAITGAAISHCQGTRPTPIPC